VRADRQIILSPDIRGMLATTIRGCQTVIIELDQNALETATRALPNSCGCEQCLDVLRERARAIITAYLASLTQGAPAMTTTQSAVSNRKGSQ
jgi:hypothetical protein